MSQLTTYFRRITPSNEMLKDLMSLPSHKLRHLTHRVFTFVGYNNFEWTQILKFLTTREDFIREILEFVVLGKYEFGYTFDKTYVKRIPASSLEELELKLVVMGY